jgi:hypothetical protein
VDPIAPNVLWGGWSRYFRTSSKARPIRVSEAAKARMLKTDQFMERQFAQTSGAATKNIISEEVQYLGRDNKIISRYEPIMAWDFTFSDFGSSIALHRLKVPEAAASMPRSRSTPIARRRRSAISRSRS